MYLLLRRISQLPPHRRRGKYLKLGAGVAVVAVVLLTLAGKMHWIGAALTGLLVAARQSLPLLIRLFPLLSGLRGRKSQAGPQRSTVSTETLRMHLDLDSGNLSGEVIGGPFKDWRLEEMDQEQLRELLEYCQAHDREAAQLLEGYLEQRFGAAAGSAGGASTGAAAPNSGAMSRKEALEILGLDDKADRDAIVSAHRKLMQKLHPDRGGSDYLAAKINQAKDLLLS
jgi:hypothetical protein